MVSEQDRQWMWREYAPISRMRLNLGIRRRLAPLLDNDRSKLALAFSLLLSLPGSPVLYYGDEIGMGDDIGLEDRNGLRTPMQWTPGRTAGFSTAAPNLLYLPLIQDPVYGAQQVNVLSQQQDPGSQLNLVKRMIAVRKQHPALAVGKLEWVEAEASPAVLAFYRVMLEETILVVHNLSHKEQRVTIKDARGGRFEELFRGLHVAGSNGELKLVLEPCDYLWLRST
jgi:maltose alpha-D-glucosyltransferase/alpha-amylase